MTYTMDENGQPQAVDTGTLWYAPSVRCTCEIPPGTHPGEHHELGCQLVTPPRDGETRWCGLCGSTTGHLWVAVQGNVPILCKGPAAAQTVENLSNELCVGAEPGQPVVTQDELLTALGELLDSALHDERCYIDENDTTCVCVIGKVRASLPPCGAVRGVEPLWACKRTAHPSSPDRHTF